jgi:hypothetical protein
MSLPISMTIWCFIKGTGGVFLMAAGIGLVRMMVAGCIWSVEFPVPSMAFVPVSGITTENISVSTMMMSATTIQEVLKAVTRMEALEVAIRREVPEATFNRREVLETASTRREVPEAIFKRREVLEAVSIRREVPEAAAKRREVLEVEAITMDRMMITSTTDVREG